MYYITCNNKYACHIGFLCHLLKIDATVVADVANQAYSLKDDPEYILYYSRVLNNLYRESNMYMSLEFLQYYISVKSNYETSTAFPIDLVITETSLPLAESQLYSFLVSQNIILVATTYTNELFPRPPFMNWIYNEYLGRPISSTEIAFWQMNCVAHKVNVCCFIMILIFNDEGMSLLLHIPFYNEIKFAKYNIPGVPNIAVIFHSYSRNYLQRFTSHYKYIIDNPYFDVFIHTWNDRGHKYEFQLEKINATQVQSIYQTKAFATEDIWSKLKPAFSLVGRMFPIFLENDQDKGDATQYINAKLYSIQKAFELIKEYEVENGFTYMGIIKLGFDIDITAVDMKMIVEHMNTGNMYFRDGCSKCDKEVYNIPKKHLDHSDPLDLTWYYGNRIVIEDALNLYNNAQTIAESFQTSNMNNINNVAHRQRLDFVYVYKPEINNIWSDMNRRVFCYTEQRLMREQLKSIKCKTSKAIGCEIITPAVFGNNL